MILKLNDTEIELDFDICEPDTIEKYEKALDKVIEKTTFNEKDKLSTSEKVRIQCLAVFEFFDSVFGEGSKEDIFGEKVNLRDCLIAFNQVIEEAARQNKEIEELTNKYTPNRAQRRHKKNVGV